MLKKVCYSIGVILRLATIMAIYSVIGYIFFSTLYHYIFIGY